MFLSKYSSYLSAFLRTKCAEASRKRALSQFVDYEKQDSLAIITLRRPEKQNAIDSILADDIGEALNMFENDPDADVGVLYGVGGSFSSGTDLKSCSLDNVEATWSKTIPKLSKPTVCGISGYCVGSGLELALLCDLRVIEEDACLGFFNRRFGVPLMDGGPQRLAALIGLSRALDLVLTGRVVSGKEAFDIGLSNRLVAPGTSLGQAVTVAKCLAKFPMAALRYDRASLYNASFASTSFAPESISPLLIDEMAEGVRVFRGGVGRGGKTQNIKKNSMADWEMAEYNIELRAKRKKNDGI